MFSRFKKPDQLEAKPAVTTAQASSIQAVPASPATPSRTMMSRRPPVGAEVPSAQAVAADKEKKRKEKLGDLKVELHSRLLDNLNLAALETATEADLKQEIIAISAEALEEMSVVLNKEERATLNQDLYDEVMALARLSRF
jgi:pilus assembly protein CpaF